MPFIKYLLSTLGFTRPLETMQKGEAIKNLHGDNTSLGLLGKKVHDNIRHVSASLWTKDVVGRKQSIFHQETTEVYVWTH